MNGEQGHGRISRRSLGVLGLTTAVLGGAASFAHATTTTTDNRLVTALKLRLDSPEYARLYGPGTATITSLANMVVGIPSTHEYVASYRFRSLVAGRLDRIQLYWAAGTGYSKGNGGRIRIRVLPDDGSADHLPKLGASPLAETVHTPRLNGKPSSVLDPLSFTTSTGELAKGELYHVVFDNLDPNPAANYISVDTQSVPTQVGRPMRWINDTDWSALMGTRKARTSGNYTWKNLSVTGSGQKLFCPIMQLTTVDGATQGCSDIESGSVVSRPDGKKDVRVHRATAGRPVRELFTPSSTKRVTGLSVATVAERPGSLQWRITRDDKELASGRITQATANFATFTRGKSNLANHVWYDVPLPKEITLEAGGSYGIEFAPEGSSQWVFCGHINGASYGFSMPAAFTESNAQHWTGSAWVNTNFRDLTKPRKDTNWPVVLHLAP